MGNYNRNNKSGGGRFGGGDFRRRDSGRRQMHKAVCDECGKDCEVPFKPSGDKPIYCSSCFEKKEGGGPRRPTRRGSGGSDFGKRDNTNKQLLEQVSALNTKLDRILKVLEPNIEKKSVVEKPKVKKTVKKTAPKVKKAKVKKASKKETKKASKKDK
jgi:CxxC-x17-CxxC domain-containing protein